MTTITDLTTFTAEIYDRIVAMEKAAVPNTAAGSYVSFTATGTNWYWTNMMDPIVTETQGHGVNEYQITIPFRMRLHTGWATQGLAGQMETDLQVKYVPNVLKYFLARRDLVYLSTHQRPAFMLNDIDFSCTTALGFFTQTDAANSPMMLGSDFRLVVTALIPITRTI